MIFSAFWSTIYSVSFCSEKIFKCIQRHFMLVSIPILSCVYVWFTATTFVHFSFDFTKRTAEIGVSCEDLQENSHIVVPVIRRLTEFQNLYTRLGAVITLLFLILNQTPFKSAMIF